MLLIWDLFLSFPLSCFRFIFSFLGPQSLLFFPFLTWFCFSELYLHWFLKKEYIQGNFWVFGYIQCLYSAYIIVWLSIESPGENQFFLIILKAAALPSSLYYCQSLLCHPLCSFPSMSTVFVFLCILICYELSIVVFMNYFDHLAFLTWKLMPLVSEKMPLFSFC